MPGTIRSISLASIAALALLGCSSGTASTSPTVAATGSTVPAASGVATRVSANDASHDQLVAAMTSAGVPNADRWAREIEEYRPYDSADATLQKLQDNLAKYNPDAATLAGILAALQP